MAETADWEPTVEPPSGGPALQRPSVAVCIVTHNSADDILACLAAVERLEHRPLEVVVVDCASRDDTLERVGSHQGDLSIQTVALEKNLGYSGGMNTAIAATRAPWILSLNPDAAPRPDFLSRLLMCFDQNQDLKIGALTGRLLRPDQPAEKTILDACGMHLTMTWRHLDRGSSQIDQGQWRIRERVFGGTGAATLFRRSALDDAAVEGEVFAAEFGTFREDAELCFRLQEREWDVVYDPDAVCLHRRTSLPSRRSEMSPRANFDSLKNRFLLRAYHQDASNFVLTLVPTLWRDLSALAYVLAFEHSSLPVFPWLWKRRRQILAKRREIMRRRLCASARVNRWFIRRSLPL